MQIALAIVSIAFCVQGLVKFAVGFLAPYDARINRISSYYRRDGGIFSSASTTASHSSSSQQ